VANGVEPKMPADAITGDDCGVRAPICSLLNAAACDNAFSAGKSREGRSVHVRTSAVGRLIREATALLRRCPGVGWRLNCLARKWSERSSRSKPTYQSVCATRTTRICAGDCTFVLSNTADA
jgi:hypothetical protein